jgi:hypothetical protein
MITKSNPYILSLIAYFIEADKDIICYSTAFILYVRPEYEKGYLLPRISS